MNFSEDIRSLLYLIHGKPLARVSVEGIPCHKWRNRTRPLLGHNIRVGAGKGPIEIALVVRNVFGDRIPVYPTQNTQLNNFGNIFVATLPEPRIVSGEIAFRF